MNKLIIAKFGGSILRSGSDYIRAAKIVRSLVEKGYEVVVVVSAMEGVTDFLLKFSDFPAAEVAKKIHYRYFDALSSIIGSPAIQWSNIVRSFMFLSNELIRALWAVNVLKEMTPRINDYILSFGERFSVILMTAALNKVGLKAKWFTGREAGIVTDSTFGEAKPIDEISRKLVRETILSTLDDGKIPVITGFIAGTLEGSITVLGRGGSDYTATLLAKYLNAKEVRLYTNVPGIMTANPSKVDNAKVIPVMNFDEAIELAYLGAKRFHPRTFEPIRNTECTVKVLHIDNSEGTIINRSGGKPPLKAVAVLENLALVSVIGTGMVGKLGAAAKIASIFAEQGVNIIGIVQPISEISISFIIERNNVVKVLPRLKELIGKKLIREVFVLEPIAAASIVGQGIRSSEILEHVVKKALSWPIKIISWSISNVSISFAIPQEKVWDFTRKIHEEVILKWWIS